MAESEAVEEAALELWKAKVASRNLPESLAHGADSAERDKALQQLSQVRLDRECIAALVPAVFVFLPRLSSLYLQQNQLKSLRGIEAAKQLRFLTVAGNQLSSIECLTDLRDLMFLDVSDNSIEHLAVDEELPKALRFLNVANNPCWGVHQDALLNSLIECLPNLKEVDGVPIENSRQCAKTSPSDPDLGGEDSDGGADSEYEYPILAADEAFLEEIERTMSDDPLMDGALGHRPTERCCTDAGLNFNVDKALGQDAVQSLFQLKSQLLHKSFEEILQRSRTRLQEIQEVDRARPSQKFKKGEAREKLLDYLSASSLAKELASQGAEP